MAINREKRVQMDEITVVKNKIKDAEWAVKIQECQASGLSIAEWCRQNGVNIKAYYYRLRKAREHIIEQIPVPINTLRKSSLKLHADETVVQVLKEPDRKAKTQSRMWVYCTGKYAEKFIALFEYAPTRAGENAVRFLNDYSGYPEELSREEKYNGRQEQVKNVLDEFFAWLETVNASGGTKLAGGSSVCPE